MKFDSKSIRKRWGSLTTALCTAVLLYVALNHLNLIFGSIGKVLGFASPVFTGLIIAYIVDPLVMLFQNHIFARIRRYKVRRSLSVLCAVLLIVLGIIYLIVALVPQVINSVTALLSNIDNYTNAAKDWMEQLETKTSQHNFDISGVTQSVEDFVDNLSSRLPQNLDTYLDTAVTVSRRVINMVIACILAIYFLVDKVRLQNWFRRLFRACVLEKTYANSAAFWNKCNYIIIHFIIYDLLDGLIVGVTNYMFMAIAQMPYAILISVAVGVTNLAPTFGPIAGGAIGALILVLINPWHALWFLIFTIILQTFDGYVLKPRLFGTLLGVSGVWILVCLVVGGRMFGVPGVLLGIPFAAISDYIYHEFILVKLDERKKRREAAVPVRAAGPQQDNPEETAVPETAAGADREAQDADEK